MNIFDAHYFLLPSQANVYSLANLCMADGCNKFLVASLKRKVYSFEFMKDSIEGFLQPTVKEVLFTYIPSGAEIISIDAFNKSETGEEFVIGITIIKSGGEPTEETYLNIYAEWDPCAEFNLENVAQNCFMLELDFIPYQLYHTDLYSMSSDNTFSKEVIWLLSGNDEKVHLFREDKANHCYYEADVAESFVEFTDVPSVVMWMDVFYFEDGYRRISAFGCECGFVKVAIVDVLKNKVTSCWSTAAEGPVSSVRLFTKEPFLKWPSFILKPKVETTSEMPQIHLLVTNTVKPSMVYMNVVENGLSRAMCLPASDQSDVVLSSCIADINMDGEHEILLGTYGQKMLTFQHITKSNASTTLENDNEIGWELINQQSFANPVHCLRYFDVTGDGVRELIAITQRGFHVMQHDPDEIAEKIAGRLQNTVILNQTASKDSGK